MGRGSEHVDLFTSLRELQFPQYNAHCALPPGPALPALTLRAHNKELRNVGPVLLFGRNAVLWGVSCLVYVRKLCAATYEKKSNQYLVIMRKTSRYFAKYRAARTKVLIDAGQHFAQQHTHPVYI